MNRSLILELPLWRESPVRMRETKLSRLVLKHRRELDWSLPSTSSRPEFPPKEDKVETRVYIENSSFRGKSHDDSLMLIRGP